MKITKKIVINQPADLVWNFIAYDFDQAHLWMGPIPHSYAIGSGNSKQGAPMEGRICHLSDKADGAKAKEVITAFDDAKKSLTFEVTSINVPAIVPVKKNVVTMTVKRLGANQSEVIWVSRPQIKAFAYPLYPLLKLGAGAAFKGLLKGLKDYAENHLTQKTVSSAASKLKSA